MPQCLAKKEKPVKKLLYPINWHKMQADVEEALPSIFWLVCGGLLQLRGHQYHGEAYILQYMPWPNQKLAGESIQL